MKPNLFLIGSAKCATSSLAEAMSFHNEICLAKGKEPIYFNTNEYANNIEFYKDKYFSHSEGEQYHLDANVMNMVCGYVPERIYETTLLNCKPKFIMVIRDPMERAFSHWQMKNNYRPGYEYDNFLDSLAVNLQNFNRQKFSLESERMRNFDGVNFSYMQTHIEHSMYALQLKKYLKFFDIFDFHFIIFDDLVNNFSGIYNDLIDWLDLKKQPLPGAPHLRKSNSKIEYKKFLIENKNHSIFTNAQQIINRDFKEFTKITGIKNRWN